MMSLICEDIHETATIIKIMTHKEVTVYNGYAHYFDCVCNKHLRFSFFLININSFSLPKSAIRLVYFYPHLKI